MKKLVILLLLTFSYHFGFAQYPEKPSTYALVNDLTGSTLTADQIATLDRKLKIFEDSTTNQVAVVIMKSVGEYDINEYAYELGRKWGIGGKEKSNGIILLVAIGDRKMSIQTGYGLEGALPDMYTKRIIENDIKPSFKQGNYYEGIDAGINSIISMIKGEYKNDNPKAKKNRSMASKGSAAFVVMMIIIIVIAILRRGGRGGGGQVIGGRGVAEAILFGALLGGGGRSSGGGWGGGSDGGGFGSGGFGGGSFGGGGSSGSW